MSGLDIDDPVKFETLVSSPRIVPGDTIKLAPGIYKPPPGWPTRNWIISDQVSGTVDAPVIICPRDGPGTVTIDGGLDILGAYVQLQDLEITNTDTVRVCSGTDRPAGVVLNNDGCKVINCIIHDTGHPGICIPGGSLGCEISECIIYHVGIYDTTDMTDDTPWTRGSAIYAQSFDSLILENNTAFRCFTTGGKSYGSGVSGHSWKGHVSFRNPEDGLMAMNYVTVMDNMVFDDSVVFSCGLSRFGGPYIGDEVVHENLTIQNCYFILDRQSLVFSYVDKPHFKNNIVIQRGTGEIRALDWTKRFIDPVWDFDNNKYFGGVYTGGILRDAEHPVMNNSQYLEQLPSANVVKIHANKYDTDRARVTIINWENAAYQDVDMGALLSAGDNYSVRDVQNYYGGPVVFGVYDGSIRFPLDLTEVSAIIGDCPHMGTITNTAPAFACFVVEKLA